MAYKLQIRNSYEKMEYLERPRPGLVKYFLDPDPTRIRWVSKSKTHTIKKGEGPRRVQQGSGAMTIPKCG